MSLLEDAIRNTNARIQEYDYFAQALGQAVHNVKLKHIKLKYEIKSETILSLFEDDDSAALVELETHYPDLAKDYLSNKEEFEKIKIESVVKYSEVSKNLLLSLRDLICVREFSPEIKNYFKSVQIHFDPECADSNITQILIAFHSGAILTLSPEAMRIATEFKTGPSFCNPDHEDYKLSAGRRKGYYLAKIDSMLNYIGSKMKNFKRE